MRSLGSRGRTGNAFFQYAFLRGYALSIGADIQTPAWWGRNVFPVAASDPLINSTLPQTHCDSVTHHLGLPLGYFFGETNIDLQGYMQHQLFLDWYTRRQVLDWFRLAPDLIEHSPHERGEDNYSAIHLRRGDYTVPPFNALYCTVSDESYNKAVEQFNIPCPVISVFEGCVPVDKHLMDLGVPWLSDWLTLRDADHLLRSNSTFSWWAATLGHGMVYAPLVEKKVGLQDVPFVIGNWPNTAGVFPNQSDLDLNES